MSTLAVRLKNIKLIKELEAKFTSGNVWAITGPNNIGKTTVIENGIIDTLMAIASQGELTVGEKQGYKDVVLVNKAGDAYKVTVELKEGKKPSMTLIRPDLSKSKRITDIRQVFDYQNIFPEQFMALGNTEPGRRKQAEMLIGLMDEDIRRHLNNLESTIDADYNDRKEAGVMMKNYPLGEEPTEEDRNVYDKLDEWKGLVTKQEEEYSEAVMYKHTYDNNIIRVQDDIHKAQTSIESLKQDLRDAEAYLKEKEEDHEDMLKNPPVDTTEMKEKLEKNRGVIEKAREIKMKVDNYDANYVKYTEYESKYFNLNESIKANRKRYQEMIEDNIPVENIVIEDKQLYYIDDKEKVPFDEKSLSYSRGVLTTAKLMVAMNPTVPLVCVGKAAELDLQSLADLRKLAEDEDIIVILDKVIGEEQPLTIKLIEDVETKEEK